MARLILHRSGGERHTTPSWTVVERYSPSVIHNQHVPRVAFYTVLQVCPLKGVCSIYRTPVEDVMVGLLKSNTTERMDALSCTGRGDGAYLLIGG